MKYDATRKAVRFLEDVAITKFSAPAVNRGPTVNPLTNINTDISTTTQQIPCQFYNGEPLGYKR
jgi:hypothetical protein